MQWPDATGRKGIHSYKGLCGRVWDGRSRPGTRWKAEESTGDGAIETRASAYAWEGSESKAHGEESEGDLVDGFAASLNDWYPTSYNVVMSKIPICRT